MTADQTRRAIRADLHAARCADGDHGEERMWRDARALDAKLAELGLPHPHTWWGTKPTSERGEIPAHLAAFLLKKSTNAVSPDQSPQS